MATTSPKIILSFICLTTINGCGDKTNLPVVTTSEVIEIEGDSVICSGEVVEDGGSEIIARGVCWDDDINPDLGDNFTQDGVGKGVFNSTIKGFQGGKKYHVRSYATNEFGTGYGNEVSFTVDRYIVTGYVLDQISRKPVEGAKIILGGQLFGEIDRDLIVYNDVFAISDVNGEYKILIPVTYYQDRDITPRLFASKAGYAGSNYPVPCEGGEMEEDIELYHEATLTLHVKNDTVNNQVDTLDFGIWGEFSFMSYPGYIGRFYTTLMRPVMYNCSGRDFDEVFEFNPLWGNLKYQIGLRVKDSPEFDPIFEVIAMPDSTINYSITF